MSEPRTPAHVRAHGASSDGEAKLLAAMLSNKPVVSGYRPGDLAEAATEAGASAYTAERPASRPHRKHTISSRSGGIREAVTDEERREMGALYRDMCREGVEPKGILERISERLTKRRAPQCVGTQLHRMGARLFRTQGAKGARR